MSSFQTALVLPQEFGWLPQVRHLLAPAETPARVRDADFSNLQLRESLGGKRGATEKFIGRCFAQSFGATVESFMPRLFAVGPNETEIFGAFGVRAASGRLFLDQYLDAPIEDLIAQHAGQRVDRRSVVEVGHFSGTFPGATRAMIALLTDRLYREGFEWVVFTGTAGLRNAFARLGLRPIDICPAEASRLPEEQRAAWGSYYEHLPRVLVGNIHEGFQHLRSAKGALA